MLGVSADADGDPAAMAFPNWITLPGGPGLALGARLAFRARLAVGARMAPSICLFGLLLRPFPPRPCPGRRGACVRANLLREIWDHIRLRRPRGDAARRYNVLQKLAYIAVIFVLLPLMVLTGLTMSPAVTAAVPVLFDMFGGRQSARTIHFLVANLSCCS